MFGLRGGRNMQIEVAIRQFIESASVERNLSRLTIKAYSGDLQRFNKRIGNREVESLTIEDLRGFMESLGHENHYQDASIRRALATLKVFFRFLEDERIIADSPARHIRGHFAVTRKLPRVMSLKEIRSLLKACHRHATESRTTAASKGDACSLDSESFRATRDRACFELLFATGMRIGELVALDVVDVNLDDRTVRILGKGRRERIAYVSSDEALRSVRDYLSVRVPVAGSQSAFVLNKHGKRSTIFSIENAFAKYCRLGRIKRSFTPHCLRHTMATMLLNNGADIRSVQEILGHRTIITTQIYTEVSIGQKRRTMMRFHERNRMQFDRLPMARIEPIPQAAESGV